MILLDTNVLSELMRPQRDTGVVAWLDQQPAFDLFISAVTRAEIELGIALLPVSRRRQEIRVAAGQMFDQFRDRCLAFDASAAVHYGTLVAHRTRIGRPISTEDAQIAATALTHGLRLATRNTKDYAEIAHLVLVNPWEL